MSKTTADKPNMLPPRTNQLMRTLTEPYDATATCSPPPMNRFCTFPRYRNSGGQRFATNVSSRDSRQRTAPCGRSLHSSRRRCRQQFERRSSHNAATQNLLHLCDLRNVPRCINTSKLFNRNFLFRVPRESEGWERQQGAGSWRTGEPVSARQTDATC